MTSHSRRTVLGLIGAAPLVAGLPATARAEGRDLEARIQEIMSWPDLAGSRWGMRFQLGSQPVYTLNADQPFVPASAYKVFPAGTAFSTLGAGHRFRTVVHRTGPVARGTLRGNLVLVASGDLLLGPRIRPDGTIALPDPDHSYGSTELIPGDPLRQLRHLARQVARHGIRRVEGRVLVDVSLFRQGQESIANGNATIPVSPIMLNDNIVDVVVTPGDHAGAPARLRVSPDLSYVDIVNEVTTVPAPARYLVFTEAGPGTVRLTGDIGLGGPPMVRPYHVPDPVRFAELAFVQALRDEGVAIGSSTVDDRCRVQVAEHVSPPLSEQVKVMLKLSSNVHTVYFPYLVGAIAGRDPVTAEATGERYQRTLFEQAGLDPDSGYSPDFFVRFLTHMVRQPYFPVFRAALPILGRDGTLTDVVPDSPAAGHVFAKTGTGGTRDRLYKALAGYAVLPDGRQLVFAEFMEKPVSSSAEAFALQARAGTALGEIVTAVYESLRSH